MGHRSVGAQLKPSEGHKKFTYTHTEVKVSGKKLNDGYQKPTDTYPEPTGTHQEVEFLYF